MTEEITLRVELPAVAEEPYGIVVRCGGTKAEVYEHGHRGSGDWAAWMSGGRIIGEGGRDGYTQAQALADAREYVTREERRRLAHAQLRAALLDGGDES